LHSGQRASNGTYRNPASYLEFLTHKKHLLWPCPKGVTTCAAQAPSKNLTQYTPWRKALLDSSAVNLTKVKIVG